MFPQALNVVSLAAKIIQQLYTVVHNLGDILIQVANESTCFLQIAFESCILERKKALNIYQNMMLIGMSARCHLVGGDHDCHSSTCPIPLCLSGTAVIIPEHAQKIF
uniref:Uncharacterized protein n=1 Tax=Sphaerodactylus townsendi TaxID=933632 RepID=A0ACB8GEH4_9SAUR